VDSEGATPRLCRRRAAAGDVIVCVLSCAVVPSCFNVTAVNDISGVSTRQTRLMTRLASAELISVELFRSIVH